MSEVFSLGYFCTLNKTTEELKLVAYNFFVLLYLSMLVCFTIINFFSNVTMLHGTWLDEAAWGDNSVSDELIISMNL